MYTYAITQAESEFLQPGMRVAVTFGKRKVYTALVFEVHANPPIGYEAKPINQILDETPVVNQSQLIHWQWVASYYMCTLGEVVRAALPSAFLLESETAILKNTSFENETDLTDEEFLIFEALQHHSELNVQQIMDILDKKKVFPVLNQMIEKEAIVLKERIYEQYKPKLVKYVKLNPNYSDNDLERLLEQLNRAKKQRELVLSYFQLEVSTKKPIKVEDLLLESGCSSSILKALVDKEIFEIYHIQKDRIEFDGDTTEFKQLNEYQQNGLQEIKDSFNKHEVTLLHGVTSSGKTEIYAELIKEQLELGNQVLYLVPEIALTTQLIVRLQAYFGKHVSVFHSKYSMNERVEVWNNVLYQKEKAQIVVGARSSLFLPFSNLNLVIVDEEHETSYKQFDPAPRYHARDAAIVLAYQHEAKVLLGSATPSIESYQNAKENKYGLVEITRRHGDVLMPEIELVDIKEKYRKKRMNGHFSDRLIELISEALNEKEQIILFQNRRGYAPIVECKTCGVAPQCPNCDVSLTYHQYKNELRCHYCGYHQAMLSSCGACGSATLDTKGFGTEQIENELKDLFPESNVGRMDLDTTRGKFGYQKIIGQFEAQEIEILVGTQMLSKGLDFSNVSLVGVLNADNMLNFPDFRAHERSFQMLVQVSGRAGRSKKRGKVAIQTFNPYHQILQQVSTNDYGQMFKDQILERRQFQYPPFYRIVKITLKHRDYNKVDSGANWMGTSLQNAFGKLVLGPTVPAISRIRNEYIRTIVIKIDPKQSLKATKNHILKIKNTFEAVKDFRPIKCIIDVDNY
ncbi:primosomal protein N' [Urechidicola sp. KH5]